MPKRISCIVALFAITMVPTASLGAGQPAARVGDSTRVAGRSVSLGDPTVIVCGNPAARVGDNVVGGTLVVVQNIGLAPTGVPSQVLPGPILTGSATVLIGGKPAARVGSTVQDLTAITSIGPPPPPDSIAPPGCPTVLIGP